MPTSIRYSIQGLVASINIDDYKDISAQLYAQQVLRKKVYGGQFNGRITCDYVASSIVKFVNHKCVLVGLGAIKYLMQNNPLYNFVLENSNPSMDERPRRLPKEFIVPEKLLNHKNFLLNGKPRDYFYESLDAIKNNSIGMIKLPTQSGKTSIELTAAYNLSKQVGPGLVISYSSALKSQMLRRAEEYGLSDYCEYDKGQAGIEFVTAQTLYRRIKSEVDFSRYKWIIVDECHHIKSDTSQLFFYGMTNLIRAYGFSATPTIKIIKPGSINFTKFDYDDAIRISYLGPIIYEKDTKDMIDKGITNNTVLINYKYLWSFDSVSEAASHMPNYELTNYDNNLELIYYNEERKDIINQIQNALINSGRLTICNVTRRKMGFDLCSRMDRDDTAIWYGGGKVYENAKLSIKLGDYKAKPYKNIECESNYMYVSDLLNNNTINQYYGKEIKALITTNTVGSEGISMDKPINANILSEGKGTNRIAVLQKAGRTSGANSDKISVIINIFDEGQNIPVLVNHAKSRAKSIRDEYGIKKAYNVSSIKELTELLNKIDSKLNV